MPPMPRRQSALRAPLNYLLGTEASVRVLRVLVHADAPLLAAEIARRAALQRASVTATVRRLSDVGVVEPVGLGTGQLVRLRSEHPLGAAIAALFRAEVDRYRRIEEGLRKGVVALGPSLDAAWIEGPVAQCIDTPGDPVSVRLVAAASHLRGLCDAFRKAVIPLEQAEDVTVDIVGSTCADLEAAPAVERDRWAEVIPLHGLAPAVLLGGGTPAAKTGARRSHADADADALAFARRLADRLAQDPTLVRDALQLLQRRLLVASNRLRPELEEWDTVLRTMSLARLRRFLIDPGERATRLRQSLPFIGLEQVRSELAQAPGESAARRASPASSQRHS